MTTRTTRTSKPQSKRRFPITGQVPHRKPAMSAKSAAKKTQNKVMVALHTMMDEIKGVFSRGKKAKPRRKPARKR